jgi:hypothetical protein
MPQSRAQKNVLTDLLGPSSEKEVISTPTSPVGASSPMTFNSRSGDTTKEIVGKVGTHMKKAKATKAANRAIADAAEKKRGASIDEQLAAREKIVKGVKK